jgi:GT2 family glycosyltransferase
VSRVSVVVVSYNTREALRRCLASLGEADEVVVVDNASADGSAEMVSAAFPASLLVQNAENRGFGAACNQGLELASGELVLLLNSDAAARPGAVRELASMMRSHPDVVACGGMLVWPDGRLQESCANALTLWAVFCEQTWLEKAFPQSRTFSPYWTSARLLRESAARAHRPSSGEGRTFDVQQVMGACLMLRRPVPASAHNEARFDERFFLYCEDTELCRRLRRHGRIVWVPEAVFEHELGSSSAHRWRAVAFYNRGKELYFRIHHGPWAAACCFAMDRCGALLRALVWGVASVCTLFLVPGFWRRAGMSVRVLTGPVDPYRSARSE